MRDDLKIELPRALGSATKGHMIRRTVIALFGHKQHGKDTVAAMLGLALQSAGYRAKQFALADPLKRVAMELLGMPAEIAFGHGVSTEERERLRESWTYGDKTARQWMQWIGTELVREQINPLLWVDRAVQTVTADAHGTHYFLISDCRFHNELSGLRAKCADQFVRFVPVRIHRPDEPVNLDHRSETELTEMTNDQFDYVIHNTGTIEELQTRVRGVADHIMPSAYAESE